MDTKRLLQVQSERGAKASNTESSRKSIEFVVNDCRRFIQENSDKYRDVNSETKKNTIKALIVEFVMHTNYIIEGYTDDNHVTDTNKLIDKLTDDITDYGILTQAMVDPEVFEIRCNGKELKAEIGGRVTDLKDKEGHILSFDNPEQQDIVMRKLLGDVRLTPKDAVVNARTVEGFRIAAVHSSALSPDPNEPTADLYHAFVLRKFKKSKMDLGQIVKFGTLSDNMARLLALATAGGLTFFTVGPTASGKTTTNNAILQSMPATTRTVLLQNPSEIDLRFKDPAGRVYNDVLHLEAREIENPTPTDPTMPNLMAHILRLSPTFVCFGELRTNPEFKLGLQIAQAGHPMNCTFHAESSKGAVQRFLTAYLAESGNEPSHLALATLTDLVRLIIVQKIMRDGSRRILQISEVVGVKEDNPNAPDINDLYKFVIDKEPDYDAAGNVTKIYGHHQRVGKLSDRIIEKLKTEGVATTRFDYLLGEVNPDEKETYTGENIETYGMNITETKENNGLKLDPM